MRKSEKTLNKWVDITVNTEDNEWVVHFDPATPEAVKAKEKAKN